MIREIIEELSKKDGFYSRSGSVDSTQVQELESSLGITLPDSYREFLVEHGFIEWFGHVICGICEDEECDAECYTREARALELPDRDFVSIPNDGIVIEPYAGGGYYLLFSKESDRAGEVALFAHDELGKEVQSWPSFEDFLRYKLSVSR